MHIFYGRKIEDEREGENLSRNNTRIRARFLTVNTYKRYIARICVCAFRPQIVHKFKL